MELLSVLSKHVVEPALLVALALEHGLVVAPEKAVAIRRELARAVKDDRQDEHLQRCP
jgi:hypothetical protein